MTYHAAVWVDHAQAKIFHINRDGFQETVLHAPSRHRERGSAQMDHFFHDIVKEVSDAKEILVVGPGSAKLELVRHVHKHDKNLEPCIIGVESADHPTDGQLAKHIRQYFIEKDPLLGGKR